MTMPSPDSVRGRVERTLTIPLGRARAELVRAIGESGFALVIDQLTVLEGTRGSALAGASGSADKLPLRVRVRLVAADPGCSVSIELFDQWKLPVRRPVDTYQELLVKIFSALDLALRRADPGAAEFVPVQLQKLAPGSSAPTGRGQAIARLSGATNRYLEGGTPATQRREGWRDTGSLVISTAKASAAFDIEAAYGLVTVGTMVVSRPATMPAPLVAQLGLVISAVEAALERGGSTLPTVFVELDDRAIPAVEFLTQQSRIREKVAIRTLQVCTTCRLSKVINPDYTKLKAKRHRTSILSNSIGAVISPAGVSPFVLIGRLAQLNQLDLEFVCPRCQGMHAESSLITFCPQCGDQRNEAALRGCEKCKFDFRALGSTKDMWAPPFARPPVLVPPVLVPPADWAPPESAQQWAPPAGAMPQGAPPAVPMPQWAPPAVPVQQWAPPVVPVQPWAAPEPVQRVQTPGGWFADPVGRHHLRWWDGSRWSDQVLDDGVPGADPITV
ncbi:hypothetical protein ABIB25_005558 [Nakamurella sp. UYEF19]|uniref:DUF2510 domain-containing protein n=1 Tax=Nakamurella sp. UYEF19 TaxID=1756392 RepID=UPI003393A2B2